MTVAEGLFRYALVHTGISLDVLRPTWVHRETAIETFRSVCEYKPMASANHSTMKDALGNRTALEASFAKPRSVNELAIV